jgi:phosphatidylglycerophosphate synthase
MLTAVSHVPGRILTMTIGRVLVVPIVMLTYDRLQFVTALALAVFVAVDLYDGVLARALDADDVTRRVLDTAVDRASIYPVYIWLTVTGRLPLVLLLVLFAREAYCAYWGHILLRRRAVVVKADWLYRSFNLMLAAWVIAAPYLGLALGAAVFAAIMVYSLPVARDLGRSVRTVLALPPAFANVVLPAGYLRAVHTGRIVPAAKPGGVLRSA